MLFHRTVALAMVCVSERKPASVARKNEATTTRPPIRSTPDRQTHERKTQIRSEVGFSPNDQRSCPQSGRKKWAPIRSCSPSRSEVVLVSLLGLRLRLNTGNPETYRHGRKERSTSIVKSRSKFCRAQDNISSKKDLWAPRPIAKDAGVTV